MTAVVAGSYWIEGGNLRVPLQVEIDAPEPNLVTATERETGIFGAGATLAEAIEDFRDSLEDHRNLLGKLQALSRGLQEQLDFLRHHLREAR